MFAIRSHLYPESSSWSQKQICVTGWRTNGCWSKLVNVLGHCILLGISLLQALCPWWGLASKRIDIEMDIGLDTEMDTGMELGWTLRWTLGWTVGLSAEWTAGWTVGWPHLYYALICAIIPAPLIGAVISQRVFCCKKVCECEFKSAISFLLSSEHLFHHFKWFLNECNALDLPAEITSVLSSEPEFLSPLALCSLQIIQWEFIWKEVVGHKWTKLLTAGAPTWSLCTWEAGSHTQGCYHYAHWKYSASTELVFFFFSFLFP